MAQPVDLRMYGEKKEQACFLFSLQALKSDAATRVNSRVRLVSARMYGMCTPGVRDMTFNAVLTFARGRIAISHLERAIKCWTD